mmetsp:Transcript_5307/g.12029  ORF Transcript_5307/g.12029 Transcript_5307/m.12029 type:complete len:214 (+) Transcript_5307:2799-3440(+)
MEESVPTTFASRCLLRSNFWFAAIAACASACVVPAFSHLSFMSSAATSSPLSHKAVVASVANSTFFSTSTTFSATSRLTVAIFRSAIPFFVSLSCLATVSRRVCSSASWSAVALAEFSVSLFAARRFMAKKVLPPPTAVWAVCTAVSSSVRALLASSMGMSCDPFMNGVSRSATFWTASSASFTRASESLTMPSTSIFSDLSRILITVASSFS